MSTSAGRPAVAFWTILLTCAACGPTVDATLLDGSYPPRPPDQEILTYSAGSPECPFIEVAIVSAFEEPLVFASLDDALADLKARARELGGDAIVGLRQFEQGGENPRSGFTGTVIRFADERCRR